MLLIKYTMINQLELASIEVSDIITFIYSLNYSGVFWNGYSYTDYFITDQISSKYQIVHEVV